MVKTDAELALEKRYELLRKKKEEKAAKKAAADSTASKHGGASLSGAAGLTKASEDATEVPALEVLSKPAVAKLPEHIAATLSGQREQTSAALAPVALPKTVGVSKLMPKKDNRLPGAQTPSGSTLVPHQTTGSAASTGSPASAPGPLSAFERTKMILAKEAQKKRPGSPAVGTQSKATPNAPADVRVAGVATGGSVGRAGSTVVVEKGAAVTARERAAALLTSKMYSAPTTAGSARYVSGVSTPGESPGRVEAPARKAPTLKRPAARAAETMPIKRTRGGEAGGPSSGVDAGGVYDDCAVVDGVGERESKDGREVFVGDLPDNCTIEAVASALYRFGNVNSVRVMEARNFGFVTFADRGGAARAVEACRAACSGSSDARVEVRGRAITIDYARGAVPGWKRGDSLLGVEENAHNEQKYMAEIRSKAVEEYKKLGSDNGSKERWSVPGDDGAGTNAEPVVYEDI
jgi:hypothetical protein